MRILVADDSRTVRGILAEWLNSAGHHTTLATDGRTAWQLATEQEFDVAIVDYNMPRMDGLELCWHLRAGSRRRYIYLIMITAEDDQRRLIEALDAGADDFISKPISQPVLEARLRAASRILLMQRELIRVASTDVLTGATNRRQFNEIAPDEITKAHIWSTPLSVLLLDIDHFKRVNDTYGHAAGDDALRQFAMSCRRVLRSADVLGRLGGEEFAVLLPRTGPEEAALVAERIRTEIERTPVLSEGKSFPMTVSIGLSWLTLGDRTIDDIVKRADQALYRAKGEGRNRVVTEAPP